MSNLKNVNLDVANFAMQAVEEITGKDAEKAINAKEYKSLAKKTSTLIQKNGFIGTLVFNLSKIKKEQHKEVLKNIVGWNVKNLKINSMHDFKKNEMKFDAGNEVDVIKKYIKWVTSLEPREYRVITKEMMTLFGWIKRFADGMIEDKVKGAK